MNNLHLDLVRVTEAGACAAAAFVGRGDKLGTDKAATEAMRERLNKIDFCGRIVIGEGKKDQSFGLYDGEIVGSNELLKDSKDFLDIAVDPVEGTSPTAKGGYESMSVIALGGKDTFLATDCFYMKKIAYGYNIARKVKINVSDNIGQIIKMVSLALNKPLSAITVCVLDRPRHNDIVKEIRAMGCRIIFIQDCDVTACIATCMPDSGIDLYYGIGGSPEGVIAAAALKCMRGVIQCQLVEADGEPVDDKLLEIEDLATGNVLFSATGITNGLLLKGVRFANAGPITNSLTMRSESGTVREITTRHGN